MKLIILIAVLTQAFAAEVPNVDVPKVGTAPAVPPHIQHMAEQHINHILQHVPQVQNHVSQLEKQKEVVKKNVPVVGTATTRVPPHIQHMAEQHINHILQHIPQVQNHIHQLQHKKEVVQKNVVTPNVAGVPEHVQQLAKQHLTHVLQHIPHAQNHIKMHHQTPQVIPDIPNNPIHVVRHKVVAPSQVVPGKFQNVPTNVQQIVQQVHQHIPEVINAHVNRAPKAFNIPPHVQSIVQQVHQHIPYVINQHQQHQQNRVGDDSSKCNYQCTRLDLGVCATNGKCFKEFNSLCQMSKFNCMNTDKTFHQVDDAQCLDTAKPKCYPGDI